MNKYWQIQPEDSKSHYFLAKSLDVENTYQAYVKWDGCVQLTRYFNGNQNDEDSIHICDLDDFISRLQEIRDLAVQKFGNNWLI
jgi:hypothetical protein